MVNTPGTNSLNPYRRIRNYLTESCTFISPGRFFAANELKSMLAHIVVSYDVKLEDNKTRPGIGHGIAIFADPVAKVMFRRRVY